MPTRGIYAIIPPVKSDRPSGMIVKNEKADFIDLNIRYSNVK